MITARILVNYYEEESPQLNNGTLQLSIETRILKVGDLIIIKEE